jgi:hypothetical protein
MTRCEYRKRCTRAPAPGRRWCEFHYATTAAYRRARYATDLEASRKRERTRAARRRERFEDLGVCVSCGRPRDDWRKRCERCREIQAAYTRRRRRI